MTLPVGITTCAISVGPLDDFAGDTYVMTVTWQPVLDGNSDAGHVRSIVWAATGTPLASFPEKLVSTDGGQVTFNAPHVDQPGFIDGTGNAVTGWFYKATVYARDVNRKVYRKSKVFQVIQGQTTVDFDLIPDGTAVVPVTAPLPTVTSVNGETGAVVVSGGGAVDSVNTQTGVVALDQDDIPDGTTAKQYSATEKAKLAAITGTNTGDQDLSGLTPKTRTVNGHPLTSDVVVSASDITTGTLPGSVLPPLAITSVQVVASQAAMLALTAEQGDVAIRTDFTPNKAFILASNSPSTLADWKDITATDLVQSVAGLNGNISAAGLKTALNLPTDTVGDLAAKAPLASPALTGNPTAPTPTAGDNDTSIATTAFVSSALATFKPEQFGTCPGNGTDVSVFMNAAVAAAQAAAGVVVLTPNKLYTMLDALAPAYTGSGTSTTQMPVRMTTPGATTSNGFWNANPLNGGATLDLRYDGTGGAHPSKIDTRGAGTIEIDHVNVISGGTDNFPIFQTTNTAPEIHHCFIQGNTANSGSSCVQDAIFFGGTGSTVGNSANAPFQGYGGSVHHNYFSHIRRGFVGQSFCNSVPVEYNTFSTSCGNDGTTGTTTFGAAIEWVGNVGAGYCTGNTERGNTIEVPHYKFAVGLDYAVANTIGPSGYWDPSTGYVAGVYCGPNAVYNSINDGYHNTNYPLAYDPGLTNTIRTSAQSRASFYPQYKISRIPNVTVDAGGQGLITMAPSGDIVTFQTAAGNPGAGSRPAIVFQTALATTITDMVTTSGSAIITSATAAWSRQSQFMPIKGTGIPAGSLILRYISATSVELSANCTITNTGVTAQFGNLGAAPVNEIQISRTHIESQGAIGGAVGLAAAAFATATATGTDTAFQLSFTCAPGSVAGDIAVIPAGINWSAVPRYVIVPRTAAAAAVAASVYLPTKNTVSNTYITSAVALTNGSSYIWDFIAMQ